MNRLLHFPPSRPTLALLAMAALLSACGGGSDDGGTATPVTYTLGGSLSGLAAGSSVTLQNNGASNLTLQSNGPFRFDGSFPAGASYAVTLLGQPTGQACSVAAGTGTFTANVDAVRVTCAPQGGGGGGGGTTPPGTGDPGTPAPPGTPSLQVSDLAGTWLLNTCVQTGGGSARNRLRVTRQADNRVTVLTDSVLYAGSACAGAGSALGSGTPSSVTFDAVRATTNLVAFYGVETSLVGPNRVIWGRLGASELCPLADQTPSVLPTAESVAAYLTPPQTRALTCYTRQG